jgi:hypothetical protein
MGEYLKPAICDGECARWVSRRTEGMFLEVTYDTADEDDCEMGKGGTCTRDLPPGRIVPLGRLIQDIVDDDASHDDCDALSDLYFDLRGTSMRHYAKEALDRCRERTGLSAHLDDPPGETRAPSTANGEGSSPYAHGDILYASPTVRLSTLAQGNGSVGIQEPEKDLVEVPDVSPMLPATRGGGDYYPFHPGTILIGVTDENPVSDGGGGAYTTGRLLIGKTGAPVSWELPIGGSAGTVYSEGTLLVGSEHVQGILPQGEYQGILHVPPHVFTACLEDVSMPPEDAVASWKDCGLEYTVQFGVGPVTCTKVHDWVWCRSPESTGILPVSNGGSDTSSFEPPAPSPPPPCLEDTLMTPEAAYASWKDCNITVIVEYGPSNVTCFRRWWPKDVFCYAKPPLPKCALDEVMTPQEALESWKGCGRVLWVDTQETLVTCYITDFGTVRCQHPTTVYGRWPWDGGFILPQNTSVGLALIDVLWDIFTILWALFLHILGPMANMGVFLMDLLHELFDLLCLVLRWWGSYLASLLGII